MHQFLPFAWFGGKCVPFADATQSVATQPGSTHACVASWLTFAGPASRMYGAVVSTTITCRITAAAVLLDLSRAEYTSVNTVPATARTFLALNDATAGFSATTDGILEITGYSGSLANLAVV